MKNNIIKIRKQIVKNTKNTLENYKFLENDFDLNHLSNLSGKNSIISIIGTGVPNNSNINILSSEIFDEISHFKNEKDDLHGISTILSSIIGEKKKNTFQGISPDSSFLLCKAFNDSGIAYSNSICASLVWSSIKKSNIIILPYETDKEDDNIYESIEEAYKNNIIILSPKNKNGNSYPADYDIVLSVGNQSFCDIKIKKIPFVYSKYLEKKYARVTGINATLGIGSGFLARYLEKYPEYSYKTIKEFFS